MPQTTSGHLCEVSVRHEFPEHRDPVDQQRAGRQEDEAGADVACLGDSSSRLA